MRLYYKTEAKNSLSFTVNDTLVIGINASIYIVFMSVHTASKFPLINPVIIPAATLAFTVNSVYSINSVDS